MPRFDLSFKSTDPESPANLVNLVVKDESDYAVADQPLGQTYEQFLMAPCHRVVDKIAAKIFAALEEPVLARGFSLKGHKPSGEVDVSELQEVIEGPATPNGLKGARLKTVERESADLLVPDVVISAVRRAVLRQYDARAEKSLKDS